MWTAGNGRGSALRTRSATRLPQGREPSARTTGVHFLSSVSVTWPAAACFRSSTTKRGTSVSSCLGSRLPRAAQYGCFAHVVRQNAGIQAEPWHEYPSRSSSQSVPSRSPPLSVTGGSACHPRYTAPSPRATVAPPATATVTQRVMGRTGLAISTATTTTWIMVLVSMRSRSRMRQSSRHVGPRYSRRSSCPCPWQCPQTWGIWFDPVHPLRLPGSPKSSCARCGS